MWSCKIKNLTRSQLKFSSGTQIWYVLVHVILAQHLIALKIKYLWSWKFSCVSVLNSKDSWLCFFLFSEFCQSLQLKYQKPTSIASCYLSFFVKLIRYSNLLHPLSLLCGDSYLRNSCGCICVFCAWSLQMKVLNSQGQTYSM